MNDEFDKKTGSLHDCAKYGIQKYWLSDFPYLYNDWYDWYDKGEPAKTISKIISQYSGKNRSQLKILDCSCGTGNPSLSLARHGFDVVCSDGSPKMLEIVKNNSNKINVKLNIVKHPILWEHLVDYFGNNKFDIVICSGNSFCHLPPEGVRYSIKQMAQVLKNGGFLLIDVKRYNNQIREMEYKADQGWHVRKQRSDEKLVGGNTAQLLTSLSYLGANKPGRRYQVQLDASINGNRTNKVFSVWAVTAQMIRNFMKKEELHVLPLYEVQDHSDWQYDFCVGKKID